MEYETRINYIKDIFENTNRWLVFSESKNALLLGINAVVLKESITLMDSNVAESLFRSLLRFGIVFSFFFAVLVSLVSFLPKQWGSEKFDSLAVATAPSQPSEAILMFYTDIALYSEPSEYLSDLYKYYFGSVQTGFDEFGKYELDLAKEIIINSWITVRKNRCFKYSLRFTIAGMCIMALLLVIP